MEKNYPVIGQKITFNLEQKNGNKTQYVSQIEEVISEKQIKIAVPIKNHQLVTILNGTIIEVVYHFQKKGVYSLKGKVISKEKGKIPTMLIEIVGPVKKAKEEISFV